MSDIFSAEEILAIQRMLTEQAQEFPTTPFELNVTNGLDTPKKVLDESIVDIDWPTYGVEDLERLLINPLPYPVDIYAASGKKESGLVGVMTGKSFRRIFGNTAPQESRHWDDDCMCFVPHTVVWNGVKAIPYAGEDEVMRRDVDGALMGLWPLNPPRKEQLRDPVKARLAAFDED